VKKPVTFRIDPDLLEQARRAAEAENRTLTNFIETVLRARIEAAPRPQENRNFTT
jgi:DNA phosphorothioation-dependent restriction protein DptG